jgi:hypothetical protein
VNKHDNAVSLYVILVPTGNQRTNPSLNRARFD